MGKDFTWRRASAAVPPNAYGNRGDDGLVLDLPAVGIDVGRLDAAPALPTVPPPAAQDAGRERGAPGPPEHGPGRPPGANGEVVLVPIARRLGDFVTAVVLALVLGVRRRAAAPDLDRRLHELRRGR